MRRAIIYIDNNYAEFGMVQESPDNIKIMHEGTPYWGVSYEQLKDYLGFNYSTGYYVIGKDCNKFHFTPGKDQYPYNLDKYTYNTKFVEELFKDKQNIDNVINFKFIDELPYTFGLEFETAGGFIPQHKLYELGLIPLRDGSISGIEFSTVVLQGNNGLNLLKQQTELLNEYTIFDKDCSLHIHLGNFKLSEEVLIAVNNLFVNSHIEHYLPSYTFNTTLYKSNTHKNYCAYNAKYKTFEQMYYSLVGRNYYGNLFQSHPNDISGTHKWNIGSRYKAINFINALCYNGPKTVEYRMLRPTYNFDKVLGWLFIYAAYIKFAEKHNYTSAFLYKTSFSIETIIKDVYSPELANILCEFLSMTRKIVTAQNNVCDYYGMRIDIDDKVINYKTFGHYFY